MTTDWRKIPFVRLILPFILGILMAIYMQFIPQMIVVLCLCLSFFSTFIFVYFKPSFRFKWLIGVPLSIVLFLMGYQLTYLKNELNYSTHFQNILKDKEPFIIGIVTDKIEKTDYWRLTVAVNTIGEKVDSLTHCSGNLLIYLKKDSIEIPPQYGDLILSKLAIQIMQSPKNPEAFDFKQYWHLQNIHYQCFIKFDNLKILANHQGNPLMALALSWQSQFIQILKKHLTTENEFAVGAALLLGSKDAISEDIRNAYVETGAMHILAISGMHILLIFKQLEWFLNLYKSGNRRWRWTKTIILITLIALFALLTGLGASVMRAAVMASFMAIGKAMKRRVSVFNVLAASAFTLLLWNPYWLMDVGFQLSFTAVIGIALFADKFSKIFILQNKLLRWAWSNISIGLAAQLAVTPISLYYFHQFPTYFWLSGLLAGAVADIALMAGVVLMIVDKIPLLGWAIGKILFGALWLMNNFIFIIQKLPFNLLEGFWLSTWAVGLIYLALFGLVQVIKTRKLRLLFYPLSISLILANMYAFSDIKSRTNRQLIIYDISRNSVVEIIEGTNCYRFYEKFSKNIRDKNRIKFATQNYHNALKINTLNEFNFNEYVIKNSFIYQNRYIRIGNIKVLLLDRMPKIGLTLGNCFVVVHNNPKFDIRHLKQIIAFRQIIFDGSNSKWRVEKWKKECVDLGIDYYDVSEKGAWIYQF